MRCRSRPTWRAPNRDEARRTSPGRPASAAHAAAVRTVAVPCIRCAGRADLGRTHHRPALPSRGQASGRSPRARGLEPDRLIWSSRFRETTGSPINLREGRPLLAGDAAHSTARPAVRDEHRYPGRLRPAQWAYYIIGSVIEVILPRRHRPNRLQMTTTSGMLPSADRSGLSPAYALTAPGATMAAMSAG